ncbi:MAG: PilZ domain-containing protein [bacterium]
MKRKTADEEIAERKELVKTRPGVNIELTIVGMDAEDPSTPKYRSRLMEFLSGKELVILAPAVSPEKPKLSKTQEYSIKFETSKGIFSDVIKIKDLISSEGLPLLKVELVGVTEKLQRRQYFRLKQTTEFNYVVIEKASKSNEQDVFRAVRAMKKFAAAYEQSKGNLQLPNIGSTVDISQGGMQFTTKKNLQEQDLIAFVLKMDEKDTLITATVIFKEDLTPIDKNPDGTPIPPKPKDIKFSYKCRFEEIDDEGRENITRHIYKMQIQAKQVKN